MLAYVCHPLKGDVEGNRRLAIGMGRILKRMTWHGKRIVPLVPHVFSYYLEDTLEEERELGMALCLAAVQVCDVLVHKGLYLSEGMAMEVEMARQKGVGILRLGKVYDEWVLWEVNP